MLPIAAALFAVVLSQPPLEAFDPADEFPCGDRALADVLRRGLGTLSPGADSFGSSSSDAASYRRAMSYLGCPDAPPAGGGLYDRGVHALVDLTADGHGLYARKALATLANLEMQRGAFTIARDTYLRYADLYPDSPWAWVALVRAGLCEQALGRGRAAAELHLAAAHRYGDLPLASVLGRAYAAAAFEALREFDRALAHYQDALEAWDDRFGPVYDIHTPASMRRAARSGRVPASRAVDREALQLRIAALERTRRSTPAARR